MGMCLVVVSRAWVLEEGNREGLKGPKLDQERSPLKALHYA